MGKTNFGFSTEQTSTHVALRSRCPAGCATLSGELRGSSEGGFEYLLLEPRPGTCSFRRLALIRAALRPASADDPTGAATLAGGDAADGSRSERHRVSVAFNR